MMVRGLEVAARGTSNRPGSQTLCAGELQNKNGNRTPSSGENGGKRGAFQTKRRQDLKKEGGGVEKGKVSYPTSGDRNCSCIICS